MLIYKEFKFKYNNAYFLTKIKFIKYLNKLLWIFRIDRKKLWNTNLLFYEK